MLYSRSMLAQLVPQRELGKVYGLLAILDAMLPFLGKFIFLCFIPTIISALPLANPLWDSTIDTMPGAFCLVNAGVRALPKRISWLTKPAGYGPPWRPLSYCVAPPASVQSAGCSLRLVLLSECFVCFVLPEKETIIELRADHFHESPFSRGKKVTVALQDI